MLVQAAGLTIHALDRVDLQRFVQAREIAGRSLGAWRAAVLTAPDRRAQIVRDGVADGGMLGRQGLGGTVGC